MTVKIKSGFWIWLISFSWNLYLNEVVSLTLNLILFSSLMFSQIKIPDTPGSDHMTWWQSVDHWRCAGLASAHSCNLPPHSLCLRLWTEPEPESWPRTDGVGVITWLLVRANQRETTGHIATIPYWIIKSDASKMVSGMKLEKIQTQVQHLLV